MSYSNAVLTALRAYIQIIEGPLDCGMIPEEITLNTGIYEVKVSLSINEKSNQAT